MNFKEKILPFHIFIFYSQHLDVESKVRRIEIYSFPLFSLVFPGYDIISFFPHDIISRENKENEYVPALYKDVFFFFIDKQNGFRKFSHRFGKYEII
jgi:hypothetical protein